MWWLSTAVVASWRVLKPIRASASHGVWFLCGNNEVFMSYEDFPWFKDVPVGKILNVEEVSPGHLYWPDLDVDIGIETIEHPEHFQLKAK